MTWVWVVLSLFVLWTLGISLMRHGLRRALCGRQLSPTRCLARLFSCAGRETGCSLFPAAALQASAREVDSICLIKGGW